MPATETSRVSVGIARPARLIDINYLGLAEITELTDGGRLTPAHLAIVGFSQGACIASEYVLRHPGCCSVLVMFTGGLIGYDIRRWLVSGVRLA